LLILLYFITRSAVIVIEGFKQEHKEQGIIPVLAYIYMGFCAYFTLLFIRNFGEITSANQDLFKLAIEGVANENFYLKMFNPVFACVLIAFTANFCKSFFTMNSLEFGFLNGKKYGKLFENKRLVLVLVDSALRLAAAYFFIQIEHTISSKTNYLNSFEFINNIGWQALQLYGCILLWLLFNWMVLSNYKIIEKSWYWWTLIQFFGGLLLGFALIFFGSKGTAPNFKELVLVAAIPIILGTLAIIICIAVIEFKSIKDRTAFKSPQPETSIT